MSKFKVAVEWSMCGTIEVEAETLNEAICFAESDSDIPLPEGDYLEGSFLVNAEMSEYFAEERKLPLY